MSLVQVKEKHSPSPSGCLPCPALRAALTFVSLLDKALSLDHCSPAEKPFVDLPEQKGNLLLRKESREQKHRTEQDEAGAGLGP